MLRSLLLLLWCLLLALCLAAAAGAQYRDPRDPGLDDMKYRAIHGRPPAPPEEQPQAQSEEGKEGEKGKVGEEKQNQEAEKPPQYRWSNDRLLSPNAVVGERPVSPTPYPSATAAPGSPAAPGAKAGAQGGARAGQQAVPGPDSSQPMRLIVVRTESDDGQPVPLAPVMITSNQGLEIQRSYTDQYGLYSIWVPCYLPGDSDRIVYTVGVSDGLREYSQLVFCNRNNCHVKADLRFVVADDTRRRMREDTERRLRAEEEEEEERKKKEQEQGKGQGTGVKKY